jgi:2'-5' RNA ligase
MHLFAALVPPREVLDHLHAVVERVRTPPDPSAATTPGRHQAQPRGRVFHRRHPEQQATAPPPPPLDLVALDRMHLPVAKFGNLVLDEAAMLAHTLQREADCWAAPRLRLTGGVALEWPGDQCAWVGLSGDLDALRELGRGVPRVAQGQQLFVDRRQFRPFLKLGTINEHTTAPYLEELLATLADYEGPAWTQSELSLLAPAGSDAGGSSFRPFREVSLGPSPGQD